MNDLAHISVPSKFNNINNAFFLMFTYEWKCVWNCFMKTMFVVERMVRVCVTI